MRVALLLFGFLRSYKHNYQNLKNIILDKYSCDIFIHISENENREDRYINNNKNLLEKIETVIELYNPISFICEKEEGYNNTINNTVKYYYKMYQVNNLRRRYEKLNKFKYDIVIAMRPDIYFLSDYNIILSNLSKIKNNNLIYPDSNLNRIDNSSKKTINDHLCIGNSNSINIYCKFYKHLNYYFNKNFEKNNKTISFESILYEYIINNNIKHNIDNNIKYKLVLSIANSISISGDSGSGKTTISKLIKDIFKESLQLECDRYHKWDRDDKMWEDITHLNPGANYLVKMQKDYFDLKVGNNIYQVNYDHNTGSFTPLEKIESKQNIILCGLHTLYNKDIVNNNNLNIYLDPEQNLKIYWKIKRDVEKRGYTTEKVLENIEKRRLDYSTYISPQKKMADLIINYYTIDNCSYDKIDESTKIGLRLLSNKNCFLSLINYLEKNKVEFINGVEIEKNSEKIYYFFKLDTPIKDSLLFDFVEKKKLSIIKMASGYNLLVQIVILLYFVK